MQIGCIGCGNMATALLAGILNSKKARPEDVLASDISEEKREEAQRTLGIAVTAENREVAQKADLLILAVKPQFYAEIIAQIREVVRPETLLVSLAPGKTIAWLNEQLEGKCKLVRTMPNTPAMVGEGMTALCAADAVKDVEKEQVEELFRSVGKTAFVPETLMDTVTGVSGSSPAYVFLFLEALADAAVEGGMPREQAYLFAAQSAMGSAKMVLESGRHPADLKDMVCSPGGTTIEAVRVLEERGFRSAIIEATKACIQKSKGM